MRYFIVIVILNLAVLPSCRFGSSNINSKAEEEILIQYGGEYSQKEVLGTANASASSTSGGLTGKVFDLELKESGIVENYSTNLWIPASNIAYIFYTNLKDAKSNQSINVKLQLENGQSHDFVYSGTQLEKIKEFIPLFETITKKISTRDYEGILSELEIKLDAEHVKKLCGLNDSIFGRVSETKYMGFSFVENNQNKQSFIQLTGVNMRGIKNTPFSLFIDKDTKIIESFAFEF